MERNSELSCRFVRMALTNTWESLSNWTRLKPLCFASFTACNNAYASPSSVDKANCCHCVSPAVNSPELLWKHAPIVVLPIPTKNVAWTLHFNHPIRGFSHRYALKIWTSWSLGLQSLWTTNHSFQWSNATRQTWLGLLTLSFRLCHILQNNVATLLVVA
jgi:hypothetical protein